MATDTLLGGRPRRPWVRWAILGGLTAVVMLNAFIAVWLFWTGRPASQLPVVKAITRDQAPHFLFSVYGAQGPLGVATSPDGRRIYVAEGDGDRLVRIFDRSGKEVGSLQPPNEAFGTHSPRYVAVDAKGQIYVSDAFVQKILVYSPEGDLINEMAGPPGDDNWAPLALSVSPAGDLYVTEASADRQRVLVFDSQGEQKLVFGEAGADPGQISFANGVVADDKGRIFVSDGNNGRIEIFGPDGTFLEAVSGSDAGSFGLPRGLALDDLGRLYVVDSVSQDVVVFDVEGPRTKLLFSFGGYGIGDGQWRYPVGIAVDGSGRVYVTDRVNNRIQVWSY